MKTVAGIQSNYLPWKGYFDIINDADEFIFGDDLQYTKKDWRNRNKIKTEKGCAWITVPVGVNIKRLICDVKINNPAWQNQHWSRIQQIYGKTPYFADYRPFFEDVYLGRQWTNLSELNQYLIKTISREFLGITTVFRDAREYGPSGSKMERLMALLSKAGADRFVSGPAAKSYIDPARFTEAGIELVWKDYSGYPEYHQPFPPFEHGVSIIDLLFNVGPQAPWYIWGWRERGA